MADVPARRRVALDLTRITPAEFIALGEDARAHAPSKRCHKRLRDAEIAEVLRALVDEAGWPLEAALAEVKRVFGIGRSQALEIKKRVRTF
jgi:hypothetical protein